MSDAVFYGFQFPHHGKFSAFSALSSSFRKTSTVRVCSIPFPVVPAWFPGRLRGTLSRSIFRLQELRIKRSFERNEIVHYFFPENSLFNGYRWKKNGKLVLSCHQPVEKIMDGNPQWRDRFLEGLRSADCIVLMASNELNEYRELAPNSKVCCIPHGVDTDFFSPDPGTQRDDERPFRILTVGNWMRDYDLWAGVVDRIGSDHDIEFSVLANPAILKKALEGVQNTECVRTLQGISDTELRDEYRRADLVFLPLEDAWANNALLESMSCGRPVVVTDLPATREYADDAVSYISKGSINEAVTQLESLIENRGLRIELGIKANQRINTRYSWKNIVESHQKLYATLSHL